MGLARQRAIALLSAHAAEIGRVCYRIGARLDPGIARISPSAGEASVGALMRTLEHFLRTRDEAALVETIRNTVALRRLAGYGTPQFVTMSHTYLPVIRRVFLKHERDPQLALAAYGVVESQALPLIVRLSHEILADSATHPTGADAFGVDEITDRALPTRTADDAPNPFAPISIEEEITAEGG